MNLHLILRIKFNLMKFEEKNLYDCKYFISKSVFYYSIIFNAYLFI